MQAFDLGYFYKPADENYYTFHRWSENGSFLLPVDYFKNDSLYDVVIAYGGKGSDTKVQKFSVAPQHPIEISGGDLQILAISIGAAVYMEASYEMAENSFVDEMNKSDTELVNLRQAYQSAEKACQQAAMNPSAAKLRLIVIQIGMLINSFLNVNIIMLRTHILRQQKRGGQDNE